ncbi:hypothetical protein G9A89_001592 [Geosiphon pyriformis]|nr:hypothetical protein G9A89_001592 [Geosiphon pyriformis]
MKKIVKDSGSDEDFKPVLPRKKRKNGALEENVGDKKSSVKELSGYSIDMEEKCLVEKTSLDYDENGILANRDPDQTLKGPGIKTKKALGKPLGKIDFANYGNIDDILSNSLLELPPPLKNLVNISVRKLFALDIGLDKVVGKSSQEKLNFVRKTFSDVNGFGGASTPSKFGGIICATFTSEVAMMAVARLTNDYDVVAIVLKKIPVETSVETVHVAVSKFGVIKMIKIQLVVARADINKHLWNVQDSFRALLYTFPVRTTAYNFYSHAHCATVCFDSESVLVGAMTATPVIKGIGLCWSCLFQALCAVCKGFGHTSLNCQSVKNAVVPGGRKAPLSAQDQFRLARIYAKKSASISRPLAFGVVSAPSVHNFHGTGMSLGSNKIGELLLLVVDDLKSHLVRIESSLVSLTGQISELAKRLELLVPAVSQPSLGCQLLEDIVMRADLSEAISDKIDLIVDLAAFPHVVKLKNMLEDFSKFVLILSAHFDSLALIGGRVVMCNVRDMNVSVKQDNITCSWLVDKFDDVCVFSSGLNSGYMGAGVVIVMNRSLAKHIYKVSEIPGHLLCIRLLFKDKLLANEINSLIVKAMNESSFVILHGDFNEDGSHKCTSFKKCHNFSLVNFLGGSSFAKHDVFIVSEHFNMDHRAVSVSLGLGDLLDTRLNSLCKQFNFKSANEIKWNNFKSSMLVNVTMFSGEFTVSVRFWNLNTMWCVVCKVMTLLTNEIFKKKWFKRFDKVFTKDSSKFHKLELLVSKIVKALYEEDARNFFFVVQNLVDSSAGFDRICSTFFGARKFYHVSKLIESLRAKETNIRSAIDKKIESFEVNKDHMIKSVLEHLFHKVVLDYLVVNNNLILEPGLVKYKMNTRKYYVADDVSIDWHHQYQPLEYVFNKAFSGVMCPIGFDEFFRVVSDLSDRKATICSGYVFDDFESLSGVLTNTRPIALIEMAHKILSKVFSDRISLTYSAFDVFCGNNFSVLKKLWLILQDMRKAYDSVGWEHFKNSLIRIKMYSKFICFFGNIYNDHTNQVITDFSLTDDYCVHDGLNQGKVFSPLLWQIFYDSLLCKVKHQESVCEYRLNSHFIFKNCYAESWARHSSFFAAGVFVDDMNWIGSSQSATQHIFNVVNEFFWINNISINNDKTVVIPINNSVSNLSLSISGLSISIAKKGKSHRYLGIFLSTEDFSKPSLVKVHSDVHFFTNLVLKKAVLDKQFLYLVSAVFHPIVSYRTQFSFVSNALICKGLKLKSGLLLDFPSNIIYHPFFYGLKFFSQYQSESKVALLISFANFGGILGCLFSHRSHDLQLSLGSSLASSFQFHDRIPMSVVLGESLFCKFLPFLRHYGVVFVDQLCDCYGSVFSWHTFKQWKKLNFCGLVPKWFELSVAFFVAPRSSLLVLANVGSLDIRGSDDFVSVYDCLSWIGADSLSVYTDSSLKNLGTIGCRAGAAAFFEDINLGLSISVQGLVSSTLMKLQAIALALVCACNSQAALDACRSESDLVCPNFYNRCWVERQHIKNVIHNKNLRVKWHKVKSHSGILENDYADSLTNTTSLSVSSGSGFLDNDLCSDVNWLCSSRVWYPDLHMPIGFTNKLTANIRTYFIKTLYHWLPMTVQKHIYDKCYLSVLCLYCVEVEVFDHVFSCVVDNLARHQVLESCMSS